MIKANRTWLGVRFFNLYSCLQLKRNFNKIRFEGNFVDAGKPLLIISNHFSWWDGFIQILLNKRFLKKQFHVMMLEEQLRQNMILNKCGAYSIKKNSRSVIDSLNYSIDLLHNRDNLVLIFPQGEIQSIYTHSFVFEQGLHYILKRLENEIQIVFNINLVDYFSDKKPSLTIYYKAYQTTNRYDLTTIESDFNIYANECMKKQLP